MTVQLLQALGWDVIATTLEMGKELKLDHLNNLTLLVFDVTDAQYVIDGLAQ